MSVWGQTWAEDDASMAGWTHCTASERYEMKCGGANAIAVTMIEVLMTTATIEGQR